MPLAVCLWCETTVKNGTTVCPECGLRNPVADPKALSGGASGKAVRRGRRVLLALLAVPLMLSVAYATGVRGLPLAASAASASQMAMATAPQPSVSPTYADPVARSVWIDGMKSVRQALGQPSYENFAGSYVNVAAGNVVSFCGEIAGTSGYDSVSGAQRFVSVFGQAGATALEGDDSSFDVLWSRVCAPEASPA
jgi:hypothetical protein